MMHIGRIRVIKATPNVLDAICICPHCGREARYGDMHMYHGEHGCPKCLGRKIAITKKAVVKGREIDSIDVCVSDEDGIEVTYRDECEDAYTLDTDGKPGSTDEVAFKTFEEAQAYADKLNGEDKK